MNKQFKEQAMKISIYLLILFSTAIVQALPSFLNLAKPNLILAVVITISMFEHELLGGLLGAFAGLLWDSSSNLLFGMGGIFFLLFSTLSALLCIYLLQQNLKNCIFLTGGFCLIYALLCYFFSYGLWGYEGASVMILHQVIPSTISTIIMASPIFWVIKRIYFHFEGEHE